MAVVSQELINDIIMTFADSNMQWGLQTLVACIEVTSVLGQDVNDVRLITKTSTVDCLISIFILINICTLEAHTFTCIYQAIKLKPYIFMQYNNSKKQ